MFPICSNSQVMRYEYFYGLHIEYERNHRAHWGRFLEMTLKAERRNEMGCSTS